MGIRENISDVKRRIGHACQKAGRDVSSVKLIAVSKTKPVASIMEAVSAGQLVFGENYAQELRDKSREIARWNAVNRSFLPSPVEFHFIGHLQKNKLKYVLPVVKWIHTIDSVELLEETIKRLEAGDLRKETINCLIEINIAGESSKSGVSPENIFGLVSAFSRTYKNSGPSNCKLRGLMCMPPFSNDPETSRPFFRKLKGLLDEINSRSIYPEELTELSMGMTQDFEVAIEEGATMVRIGSAIFGERNT